MEQFANTGQAALNQGGTLGSGTTTITVTSQVDVPSTGTFRALINSELIKVTAVSGSTWTIVRGDGGTTAASHADGTAIYLVVTKEAIDALVSVQSGGTEVATRRVLNFTGATVADNPGNGRVDVAISGGGATYDTAANRPAAGSAGKLFIPSDGAIQQVDNGSAWLGFAANAPFTIPPVIASWTWVNQGSATAADNPGGGIFLQTPAASGDSNHMLVRTLSPPYTLTAGFLTAAFSVNFMRTGIAIYDSSGGKLISYGLGNGGSGFRLFSTKYNSTTSFNADGINALAGAFPNVIWLRIADDNTNRKYYYSPDGLNWVLMLSEATGTFVSPNRVGISVNPNNTSWPSFLTLVSWKEA